MNKNYSDKLYKLMNGASDLHLHSNPSFGQDGRGFRYSDNDVMSAANELGLKYICLKNTESGTLFRDWIINNESRYSTRCLSSITLNLCWGGINPWAVDYAVKQGAFCIWFPTYSAENMLDSLLGRKREKSGLVSDNHPCKALVPNAHRGIKIVNTAGNLSEEAKAIIEITRDNNVCLATGHISAEESYKLCKTAIEMGHKKVILTHPDNRHTLVPFDEVRELAKIGVLIEKTYFSFIRDYDEERYFGHIKEIGAEHFILTSDTGQENMPIPAEALLLIAKEYIDRGFPYGDVEIMCKENPLKLVETR